MVRIFVFDRTVKRKSHSLNLESPSVHRTTEPKKPCDFVFGTEVGWGWGGVPPDLRFKPGFE